MSMRDKDRQEMNPIVSGQEKKKKKGKLWKIFLLLILLLLLAYFALVNFLVSAALIPSFMRKFSFFEEITEKSINEQIHTDDIEANLAAGTDSYHEWLDSMDFQRETLVSEDGYELVASYLASKEEDSHLWALVLHGYTGWKEAMYPYARMYYRRGYHCIIPDLRTQGESEGDYIGMGWTDHYDCMLWIDRILQMDPEARIVIHGQSMGAATALLMSGEEELSDHVKAVVSDAAYTDAYSMFGEKLTAWFSLPPFPIVDTAVLMLKLRGGYDLMDASPIDAVKKSETPTLFIHGDLDAMISVDMAYRLYDAARCEKDLLIVEGAGHAQCKDKDPDQFVKKVFEFISSYME